MEKIVQSLIDFQIGILNNVGVRTEQYTQCVRHLDSIKKILGIKQSYYMEQLNKELLGNRVWKIGNKLEERRKNMECAINGKE